MSDVQQNVHRVQHEFFVDSGCPGFKRALAKRLFSKRVSNALIEHTTKACPTNTDDASSLNFSHKRGVSIIVEGEYGLFAKGEKERVHNLISDFIKRNELDASCVCLGPNQVLSDFSFSGISIKRTKNDQLLRQISSGANTVSNEEIMEGNDSYSVISGAVTTAVRSVSEGVAETIESTVLSGTNILSKATRKVFPYRMLNLVIRSTSNDIIFENVCIGKNWKNEILSCIRQGGAIMEGHTVFSHCLKQKNQLIEIKNYLEIRIGETIYLYTTNNIRAYEDDLKKAIEKGNQISICNEIPQRTDLELSFGIEMEKTKRVKAELEENTKRIFIILVFIFFVVYPFLYK